MGQHVDSSNYGYTPSPAWCIVFIALFALSAAVHSVQAYRARYWVIYPTLVTGALVEVLGWSGRYWSSQNVLLLTPFLMQISTLIIAPVFFSAYDYVVLGTAINQLGAQYSLVRPTWYFIIFITADLISLVLQAVGGGQASSAAATGSPTQSATNIMVGGIIFQLVSMALFILLGADFIFRAATKRPYAFQVRTLERIARDGQVKRKWWGGKKTSAVAARHTMEHRGSDGSATLHGAAEPKLEAGGVTGERENLSRWWTFLAAALISSLMILIRGVYRSIELVQGWEGYLIQHQIYQNVLDGIPMFIAVAIFNALHPGWLLPQKLKWRGYH